MRGVLSAVAILALAALAAAALHELDLNPAPAAASRDPLPIVDDVREWRYRHVDPLTSAVSWEMSGDRMSPESAGRFEVEAPRIVHYGHAGADPITATALTASASLPKGAAAIVRFEKNIVAQQGSWTFRTEELVFEFPPREKGSGFDAEGRAKMTTTRRVAVVSTDPPAKFDGLGLDAAAERREARLHPPVHAEIEASTLARAEGSKAPVAAADDGPIFLETDHDVILREVRKGELEVTFTGPTRGRHQRGGETEPYTGLLRGGKLYLERDLLPREKGGEPAPAKKKTDAGTGGLLERAPARGEFAGGVELRRGEALVAWGEKLLWDGAAAVATLVGTVERQAELFEPDDKVEVHADTIRYLVRDAGAEFEGGVRGAFPYAPRGDRRQPLAGNWKLEAPRANVTFDRKDGRAVAPGEVRMIVAVGSGATAVKVRHAEDDAEGTAATARYDVKEERLELEAAPGALARFRRGKSALAARKIAVDRKTGAVRLEGEVEADLARELWADHLASPGPATGATTGTGTTAAADPNRDRKGAGKGPAGEPGRDGEGADLHTGAEASKLKASDWHVEADLVTARFTPQGGTVTAIDLEGRDRQALLRSRPRDPGDPSYEVLGSRISADRALGLISVLPAQGEISRQSLTRGRDRLEAREIRYDEARARATATGEAVFVRAAEGAEAGIRAEAATIEIEFAAERRPQALVARGAAGRPVVVVRADPKRPLRLEAPRIEGVFDPATGKLAKVHIEGDGGPVTIEPANDLPAPERFRVTGSRIVYDLETETGEVFGLGGGPPEARRGPPGAEEEWLAAKRVTFDARDELMKLRDGVRGRFFAKVPPDLRADPRSGPPRPSLFSLEADEADVSLARGVTSIEARGRVRFADADSELKADRALYDRSSSTVRLEGRPVEVVRGPKQSVAPRTLTIRIAPQEK